VTTGSIKSHTLDMDGHNIHYLKAGSGPPVVLLHGGTSDSQDWTDTIDALSHSYTLYAPDMIGYGLSASEQDSYYLADFAKFTQGFINKLGLARPALVGHSLGGRVCLEVAFRHPELIQSIVLIDTMGFANLAWWGAFLAATAWGIRKALGRPQPYPRFLMDDGENRSWRCLDKLPSLKLPTLLVWHRRDPYFSLSGALAAANLIPHVRLEIFPGFGHAPHKREKDTFSKLLFNFLKYGEKPKHSIGFTTS
jgi:pimeloyl-ACP methyl ester carboxylesterase